MKKIILLIVLSLSTTTLFAQQNNYLFKHILITNDDGAKEMDRLVALARALKPIANRVSILVSSHDRSGTSSYKAFGNDKYAYEVTTLYYNNKYNVGVYTIPDYPADCVVLGLSGIFKNDRPDLVISGINGSPNLGTSWFSSGTINAVREAALLGVPGIAFSGFNEDEPNNDKWLKAIPEWIANFLKSGIVKKMGQNSYLTVAFPRINLNKIKGIKITKRRISYKKPKAMHFKKIYGDSLNKKDAHTIWVYSPTSFSDDEASPDDISYLKQGYIIITPMTIDENNKELFQKIESMKFLLPKVNK